MKFIFITIVSFLGLNTNIAAQQVNVNGFVSDSSLNPIDAATVSLCKPDSVVITSTITNSDGYFEFVFEENFPLGEKRIIAFSHISYKNKTLTLNHINDTVINVLMEEDVHTLGEISIVSDRAAIEFSDGNLIANVSQIPHIQTANVTTLLSRLPGVAASKQGGLTYNGATAVLYIDGRKQEMSAAMIINYLNSLPASSIEQVELKSMGLASYDASGQAVINIITKKQRIDGYHGSIGAQMSTYESYNLDGASNILYMFKKNKVMFNMNLSFLNNYYAGSAFDSTYYASGESLFIDKSFNSRSNVLNGFANLNWEVFNNNSLNFNFSSFNDFGQVNESEPTFFYTESDTYSYTQSSDAYTHNDMWTGVLSFQSNEEKRFRYKILYGILSGGLRSDIDFKYNGIENYDWDKSASVRVLGERHTGEVVLELDLNDNKQLKFGVKNDFGIIADQVNYQLSEETASFLSNSSFSGNENIFASYFEFRYKLNNNWSAYSGLRGENTNYTMTIENQNINNANNYWDLFPHATLTYQTNNYRSSFGVTSGIIRPNYEHLLPGKRYYNEYTYTVGNPHLKPASFYSLILNQSFFGFINMNLGYNIIKNAYMRTPVAIDDNITENTYLNLADYERLYGVLSVPFQVLNERLIGRIGLNAFYFRFKNIHKDVFIEKNRETYWRTEFNANLLYNISQNFAINTWVEYYPATKRIFFDLEARGTVNFGAMYNTKNNNLTIALDIANLIGNYNYQYTYYYTNQRFLNNNVNNKSITLSLRYMISGGENISDRAKGIQSDTERFRPE